MIGYIEEGKSMGKAVIFGLDGTLLNTLDDLEESTKNNDFVECSLPLPGITAEMTHYYPVDNKRVLFLFSCVIAIVAVLYAISRLFL